jgi:hypothetical protein
LSGEGEIVGSIAEGAMIARAVEPVHGEGGDGHSHESACLNCGTALVGRHCHQCGQAAHVHKTLGAFFHDLMHGVFHFEGKIWRTLPLLAWNPGKLTREYIDGRRASYVSPIALFLFVVFLTFAVFNALGDPIHFDNDPKSVAEAQAKADQVIAELEKTKADAEAKGEPIPGIDGQLAGARAAREAIGAGAVQLKGGPESDQISSIEAINHAWAKAKSNPDLLIYKLQSSAYKYSWLLIPLSVPFVWLLLPFRRFHLYDHTIFVTYSLCFMLLLLAIISALAVWGSVGWLIPLLVFSAPFHMYRQLRGTYGLTRFGAWWRTWFLSLFGLIALVLFGTALTMIVASG